MANAAAASVWQSILSPVPYKRNQGRLVRYLTAAAIILAVLLGCWTFSVRVFDDLISQLVSAFPAAESAAPWIRIGVPLAMALFGSWCGWRLVHYPVFADFLIEVESEMARVTWPERHELIKATGVVLFVTITLSAVLFGFDLFWQWVLGLVGVLQIYNGTP
ncbi:MAG: preprotein translocase subunit SecE [Planctomyces sp.]|nr:preprotein translocase subunit SecE [Planctomyces sp.]